MPEIYPAYRGNAITSHVIERRPAKLYSAADHTQGSVRMHIDLTSLTTCDRRTEAEQMDTHCVEASLDGVVAELSVRDVVTTVRRNQMTPGQQRKTLKRVSAVKFFEDCAVGDTFESPHMYRVSAEEIKSFAGKWDPQLYHLDEEQAKKVVGQLFAPATLTLCISIKLTHDSGYFEISPAAGLGLDEVRMPKPVRVDDQLKVKTTIVSKRESKSRPGLGVLTNRTEVINQNEEVVLSYVLSALVYKRPH
jgi:acyl dehydratase